MVTGDITVTADNNTDVAFKNCAPFFAYKTEVNDVFIDEANHVHIAVPMYNLIEYSDSYSDTSGSLWQFIIMLIWLFIFLCLLNIKRLL